MKYTSCIHIEHGIAFFSNSVQICCISSHVGGGNIPQILNYNGEKINWKELFEKRKQIRELHQNGQIYPKCEGCYYLRDEHWDQKDYFDEVLIGHWTHCNCRCTYCYTEKDKKFFNSRQSYNILPIIKDMMKRKILAHHSIITFGGGEPTILEEFEELVYLLLKYNVKNIRIHSSGIKYSPAIAKGLSLGKITLITSLDSGTPEVYQKVKQVNCFDKVLVNLSEYAKNKGLIRSKFVIMPGVNDNLEEIEKWLTVTRDSGVKDIAYDIEDNWFKANRENIEDHLVSLMDYIEKNYKNYGLTSCELYERASNLRKDISEKTS